MRLARLSIEAMYIHERHPALARQVLTATPYPPEAQRRLLRLVDDSRGGVIDQPSDEPFDGEAWRSWGEPWFGRSWADAPFLWAESYFYRLLLEALGYYDAGAWSRIDPFAPMKDAELRDPTLDEDLRAVDRLSGLTPSRRIATLLHGCLWGNRADLGFRVDNDLADLDEATALVADDTDVVVAALSAGLSQVVLVADNAGRELLADLLLIDHLLAHGWVGQFVLHVKPRPYYVSDATGADVVACLRRLATVGGGTARAASRLGKALTRGRLVLRAHPFACAPLPFRRMPADLADEWGQAGLVLFKGDLNYRRLVGDQRYPATLPLSDVTAYFPAPFAALRTLKSDVVVGLDEPRLKELDRGEDSAVWRVNGAHGLIQAKTTIPHRRG